MTHGIRKLSGYVTMGGALALGRFSYGEQTGFNSAVGYAVGMGLFGLWMVKGRPTRWDTMASLLGVGATVMIVSGISAFNKEYGGAS